MDDLELLERGCMEFQVFLFFFALLGVFFSLLGGELICLSVGDARSLAHWYQLYVLYCTVVAAPGVAVAPPRHAGEVVKPREKFSADRRDAKGLFNRATYFRRSITRDRVF